MKSSFIEPFKECPDGDSSWKRWKQEQTRFLALKNHSTAKENPELQKLQVGATG